MARTTSMQLQTDDSGCTNILVYLIYRRMPYCYILLTLECPKNHIHMQIHFTSTFVCFFV